MTASAHFEAVRALLAGGILANRVHDVVRMNAGSPVRDNYVVLMLESSALDDDRYTALQDVDSTARYRFDVRSVATTAAAARLYLDTVRSRLIKQTPVVEGRTCTPIRLIPPLEEGTLRHDADANLYHAVESFEFWSRRTA